MSEEAPEGVAPSMQPSPEGAPPPPSKDPPDAIAEAGDDRSRPSTASTKAPEQPAEQPAEQPPAEPPSTETVSPPTQPAERAEGLDAPLVRLASEHPDLELLCPDRTCVQEADLDGDGQADTVLPVQARCDGDRCPTGVVVLPTKAPGIRIGAGVRTRLRHSDWELIDGKVVWESMGKAATPRTIRGLTLRATKKGLCARSMRLGRAILEFSGSDAAEALVFRKGRWEWVPCGF